MANNRQKLAYIDSTRVINAYQGMEKARKAYQEKWLSGKQWCSANAGYDNLNVTTDFIDNASCAVPMSNNVCLNLKPRLLMLS